MSKPGYIYRLVSPSGKSYIGQTVQDPRKRWSKHSTLADKDTPKCPALSNAINRYGFENFVKEILVECPDHQLDDYESKFIKLYDALSPNGYNLSTGGGAPKMSDDTKVKMRESAFASTRIYSKTRTDLPRGINITPNGKSFRIESVSGAGETRKRVGACVKIPSSDKEGEALQKAIQILEKIKSGTYTKGDK